MAHLILSDRVVSITELKRDPMGVIEAGVVVAVLNNNVPVFYCVPAELFEKLVRTTTEHAQLLDVIKARKAESTVPATINSDNSITFPD